MITDDKTICTPEYWNSLYRGERQDTKVDASNTKRPAQTFDRFAWAAAACEGPRVLGIASGHAHVEKRIKAKHPGWLVIASDQAGDAIPLAKFQPYWITDAYHLPWCEQGDALKWDTVVMTQALEYLERPQDFIAEARRVAHHLVMTAPLGEMERWSQLRVFKDADDLVLLFNSATDEICSVERQGDLLRIKVKFKTP